jgi:hypothetical protein
MMPQSNFMALSEVDPAREGELRGLLESMNDAPGRVNADNALIPFGQLDRLHFARLVILDDKTIEDARVYGVSPGAYPLYLAFLGDIDGDVPSFLEELVRVSADGLRAIFSCCVGFTADTDLFAWFRKRSASAIAAYVNSPGRTVRRVREEAALVAALEGYVVGNATALTTRSPREIRATLQHFVRTEKSAGRLTLAGESSTPLGWRISNFLHAIGGPLLLLIASPALIVIAPLFVIRLRHLEKSDPELCWRVDQAHSDRLAFLEDRETSNQFTAMGSVKPGLTRLWTLIGVLGTVNYAARHIVRRGRLGRIRTIHFARWVFLDGRKRMVFFSNYDGTVESYMDDFINKAGFGLNAVFSSGIGYPRTNWLIRGGCADEQKYKNFLRRHTLPTQVWYKAYPGLTAVDLERNGRIREGLNSFYMSETQIRDWLALI